jgi:hypothetical protein
MPENLLWHIDSLLGNDREKTTKQWPLLGSGPRATMELLLEAMFSI